MGILQERISELRNVLLAILFRNVGVERAFHERLVFPRISPVNLEGGRTSSFEDCVKTHKSEWMRLMHRMFRWAGLTNRGKAEVGLSGAFFQMVDEFRFSLVF